MIDYNYGEPCGNGDDIISSLVGASLRVYHNRDMCLCVTASGFCEMVQRNAHIDFMIPRSKEGLRGWIKYLKMSRDGRTHTFKLYRKC